MKASTQNALLLANQLSQMLEALWQQQEKGQHLPSYELSRLDKSIVAMASHEVFSEVGR